ncbi:translocation/assembly module TamB domain-containing protein [Methylophilus aquaticus]|uniref:Translocation/assembly module TamB domain-containing protein n=1 Tax=Methylophilus aquaticus TaxID=1971610 RepID=A0ABT9JRI7_9PROT|nr:translocation/assembly module TamB domain-containing protein [Methylophilus aquaticus]MDP8567197.1 translocation/assembly module TamB domain-containing protein [Methylophilus aquaticus]
MFKSLLRFLLVGWLCLSLIITPQIIWAANVMIMGSLTHIETDLGNAILTVDGIDSRMRLGVTPRGELTVSQFNARQVTLQFKANPPPSDKKVAAPMPSHIHIPLPFQLQSGTIERLTIKQGISITHIEHIQFDLHADSAHLQFRIMEASSPWGNIQTTFDMQNSAPFSVNGWLALKQAQGEMAYYLRTELHGDLSRLQITSAHHYQPGAKPYAIVPVNSQTEGDQIQDVVQLDASIGLDAARSSQLNFHLKNLQASHLHPQLAGKMDLQILADGSLAEHGVMRITVDAGDSHLQQQAFTVRGTASLSGTQLLAMDILAQLDQNTLRLQGAADTSSPATTQLQWQVSLPNLEQFMPGFAGQLRGQGSLRHGSEQQSAHFELQGQQLQLPQGLTLPTLQASGQISSHAQAPLKLSVQLKGLTQQDIQGNNSPPIDASLTLQGSLAQHQLALHVQDSDPQLHRTVNAQIAGMSDDRGWHGQLTQLEDETGKVFQLAHAAALNWHPQQGFELQDLDIRVIGGQLLMKQLAYRPADNASSGTVATAMQLHSQGGLKQFPLQALLAWANPTIQAPLPAQHLRLDADWNLNLDQTFNGTFQLQKASGDWLVYDTINTQWHALQLQKLSAGLQATNNRITLATTIETAQTGTLAVQADTEISPTSNGFVLKKTAPLTARLNGHLSHIDWLGKLLPDIQPAGALTLDVRANGTLAHPQLQGSITGSGLALSIPSQGLWLQQGMLNIGLQGEQMRLNQMQFSGKSGQLTGTGLLTFDQAYWQLDLGLSMDHLQALSRVDRWVELSGRSQLQITPEQTQIQGKLNIHKGLFELPKADRPQLSEDVVIASSETVSVKPASRLSFQDFELDFGSKPSPPFKESEQFMLRGQGLNGALSGQMRLNGELDQLSAAGTLDITGTYLAYGQSLNIETGRLIFSGKIPNIGLDILATRQVESTKVGIQINGSLQTPQLKLVATPETTNENKISLLVLGQPISAVGSSDMAMLSVAAGALLSQGDSVSLQTKIAQTIGLDSIDVRGSSSTNYAVSVGKRINKNLVVGYEKSIVGLLNVGKLTYQLTKRIVIETRTGSDNALDVFYSFSFD